MAPILDKQDPARQEAQRSGSLTHYSHRRIRMSQLQGRRSLALPASLLASFLRGSPPAIKGCHGPD